MKCHGWSHSSSNRCSSPVPQRRVRCRGGRRLGQCCSDNGLESTPVSWRRWRPTRLRIAPRLRQMRSHLGGGSRPSREARLTEPAELRELTQNVLGIALALTLHRAGWQVEAPPGMQVAMVSNGGRQLMPFSASAQLVSGEIGPDRWREACDRLDIAELGLVASDVAEQPETGPTEADAGQAWYPVSNRCQLGWWDRNSVLLVSSRGMLKHRVGDRAGYAAGLAGITGIGGNSKAEPVWLSDTDCERVAAEHPKNVWVRRDNIERAWLRKGLSVDRMRLQLRGGRDVKLLIPTQEGRYQALKQILTEWLGDRLTLR
jgi:hypothetical protein